MYEYDDNYGDRKVLLPEPKQSHSFNSLNTFFELFHKKYEIKQYSHFYIDSYNIHTQCGRYREWLRRAMLCNIDVEMYSSEVREWIKNTLAKFGRI